MHAPSSRQEYERRLNLVINFVVDHLDEPLSLEELAGLTMWSPYHFHRIFSGIMGETLATFLWRLRLERAANRLRAQPTVPVTRIALECGFGTPSSFARAFRQRFGMTATAYRKATAPSRHRKDGKAAAPLETYAGQPGAAWLHDQQGSPDMDVAIRQLPAYHVAYIRRRGYDKGVFQQHLNDAFRDVCEWVRARNLFRPDTLVIGLPHDNPEITAYEHCRYDACVTVPNDVVEGSDNVAVQTLAGGLYVVHRIDVSDPADIGAAVDALYGQWLPQSGYETDERPCLEVYRDADQSQGRRIVLDFCVPLTPLGR